jgi:hypothetical protein
VEADTMKEVADEGSERNNVVGNMSWRAYSQQSGRTTVTLDQNLPDELDDPDMFEGGTLTTAQQTYTVVGNTQCWWPFFDDVVVIGDCTSDSEAFALLDDDDQYNAPHRPLLHKLNPIFRDCYILCVDDGGGDPSWSDGETAFDRNFVLWPPGGYSRNSGSAEADDWWVVYTLGAYQENSHNHDNDPDGKRPDGDGDRDGTPVFGRTDDLSGNYSEIFAEAMRDAVVEMWSSSNYINCEGQAVAHEIGHQVLENGRHTAGTIMSEGLPVAPEAEKFGPQDIAEIRSKVSSPGW